MMFEIEITSNDITINRNGDEMLYWEQSEWSEDPSLTPQIARAIVMALSDPAALDVVLRKMKKLT